MTNLSHVYVNHGGTDSSVSLLYIRIIIARVAHFPVLRHNVSKKLIGPLQLSLVVVAEDVASALFVSATLATLAIANRLTISCAATVC